MCLWQFTDLSTSSLIDGIGGDISSGAPDLDFELITDETIDFGPDVEYVDVEIEIGNDAISEFSELFLVSLSNPDGVPNIDIDSSIVSIKDDDGKTRLM